MPSAKKMAANQANARSSTGPRTAAGKRRSAQNARRHGLSVPVFADPNLVPMVENLARKILDGRTDSVLVARAREIAAAQVDLGRVARSRQALLFPESPGPALAANDSSRELMALEHYTQRALSRRKAAIQAFDEAERQIAGRAGDYG